MIILSKTIRVVGVIVGIPVLAVLCLILIFDPPPLRLQDEDKFVLSVNPPLPLNLKLAGPIEDGLACKRRLQSDMNGNFGRPVITFFDWLKRQSQGVPEKDYHLSGSKPNDVWAIRLDRATKKICWLMASQIKAGITDAYCGPSIIHEDAKRIYAFDEFNYVAVAFDKTTYTLIFSGLSPFMSPPMATITYLECGVSD